MSSESSLQAALHLAEIERQKTNTHINIRTRVCHGTTLHAQLPSLGMAQLPGSHLKTRHGWLVKASLELDSEQLAQLYRTAPQGGTHKLQEYEGGRDHFKPVEKLGRLHGRRGKYTGPLDGK